MGSLLDIAQLLVQDNLIDLDDIVCSSINLRAFTAEISSFSPNLRGLSMTPAVEAACSFFGNDEINGLYSPPLELDFLSEDFELDIPNEVVVGFDCSGIEVIDTNTGNDVGFIIRIFCPLIEPLIDEQIEVSFDPQVDPLFDQLTDLTGPAFLQQTLNEVLEDTASLLSVDDFTLISQDDLKSLGEKALEEFNQNEVFQPVLAAIEARDFQSVIALVIDLLFVDNSTVPFGETNFDGFIPARELLDARDLRYSDEDSFFIEIFQFIAQVDPELAELFDLVVTGFEVGAFDNFTVPEFATILEINNQVFIQGLGNLFGNSTIEELILNQTIEEFLDVPITSLFAIFLGNNETVPLFLEEFFEDASLRDVFGIVEVPIVDLVFLFFGDSTFLRNLAASIDPTLTLLDVAVIIDSFDGLNFNNFTFDAYELFEQEVIDIIFSEDGIPDDLIDAFVGVITFIFQTVGNSEIFFDQPFGADEVDLIIVLGSFGLVDDETVLAVLAGELTVAEVFDITELFIIPLVAEVTELLIIPDFIRLRSAAEFSFDSDGTAATLTLPKFTLSEFSMEVGFVFKTVGGVNSQFKISIIATTEIVLESALSLFGNLEELNNLGLSNIQESNDVVPVLFNIVLLAVNNLGALFNIAPQMNLFIDANFEKLKDAGIETVADFVFQDVFHNVVPNIVANNMKETEALLFGSDLVDVSLTEPPQASPDNAPTPSVDEESDEDPISGDESGASAGVIAGSVIGVLVVVGILVAAVLVLKKNSSASASPADLNEKKNIDESAIPTAEAVQQS